MYNLKKPVIAYFSFALLQVPLIIITPYNWTSWASQPCYSRLDCVGLQEQRYHFIINNSAQNASISIDFLSIILKRSFQKCFQILLFFQFVLKTGTPHRLA